MCFHLNINSETSSSRWLKQITLTKKIQEFLCSELNHFEMKKLLKTQEKFQNQDDGEII